MKNKRHLGLLIFVSLVTSLLAQGVDITGTVTTQGGAPIEGALVYMQQCWRVSDRTDANGNFTLNGACRPIPFIGGTAANEDLLVVNAIGYDPASVNLSNYSGTHTIAMQEYTPPPEMVAIPFKRPFKVSKYEITQKDYAAVMGISPWRKHALGKADNYPAYALNWFDAILFCNALSKMVGLSDTAYIYSGAIQGTPGDNAIIDSVRADTTVKCYRLPTYHEFHAAYKPDSSVKDAYYWGNADARDYCWYDINAWNNTDRKGPQPVGEKLPNDYGVYDIAGNIREWITATSQGIEVDHNIFEKHNRIIMNGAFSGRISHQRLDKYCPQYPEFANAIFGMRIVLPE